MAGSDGFQALNWSVQTIFFQEYDKDQKNDAGLGFGANPNRHGMHNQVLANGRGVGSTFL